MTARLYQYNTEEIAPFISGLCGVIATQGALPPDWVARAAAAIRRGMSAAQADTIRDWADAQVTGVALGLSPLTGRYPSHLRYHAAELVDHLIEAYIEPKTLPFDYIKIAFEAGVVWVTAPSAFASVAEVAGADQVERVLERLDDRYPAWTTAQQWVWAQASGMPQELIRHRYDVPGMSKPGVLFTRHILPRLEKASQMNLQVLLQMDRTRSAVAEALRLGLDVHAPAYHGGLAGEEAYYTYLSRKDPVLFKEICAASRTSVAPGDEDAPAAPAAALKAARGAQSAMAQRL